MPNGILSLALGIAMQVGSPGPSENPFTPAPPNAYGRYGSEGSSEPRYPYDTQRNWVHGYYQELPAYGGHPFYRPYNYKHVFSQSQTAGGWGERPMMPYSQQFWHKYHDQSTMIKTTQYAPMRTTPGWSAAQPVNYSSTYTTGWSPAPGPTGYSQQNPYPQQSPVVESGPYHMPPQNFAVMPDQPRMQMPQATEIVAPSAYQSGGAYQSGNGRGY